MGERSEVILRQEENENIFGEVTYDINYSITRSNTLNNYSITDFCANIDECDENIAEKIETFSDEITL